MSCNCDPGINSTGINSCTLSIVLFSECVIPIKKILMSLHAYVTICQKLQRGEIMTPEQNQLLQDLIKKSWKDEAFKKRLLADPKTVLREMGHNVPDNYEIAFHENTPTKVNVVLPSNPA